MRNENYSKQYAALMQEQLIKKEEKQYVDLIYIVKTTMSYSKFPSK